MRNAAKLFSALALLMTGIVSLSLPSAEAQNSDLPSVVSSVAPAIPPIAIAARVRGNVVVELSLDAEGKVVSARAIEGHPLFRKSTEQAASQWRFTPTTESSRVLRLTFIYPMMGYGETTSITVLPYQINLRADIPTRPKPPETVSYIPSDWEAGKDRCNAHGEILKKDRVEIIYGLIGFRGGYLEAEKKLFPNANTVAYGGCVIEVDAASQQQISPKYADVLYCRKCRMAERRWTQKNRDRKFTA